MTQNINDRAESLNPQFEAGSQNILTVGSVLPDEVSVETLVDDDLSVIHPHQLHTEI